MNKSFETEYKNMIRADLPDLWSKIEEKLDAQEAAKKDNVIAFPTAAVTEQRNIIDDANKNNTIDSNNTTVSDASDYFASYTVKPNVENAPKTAAGTGKKKSRFRWQYFGVAAAAALCLLVGIPVMRMMKDAGNYASSTSAPASSAGSSYDGAPATAADIQMAEETIPTQQETGEAAADSNHEAKTGMAQAQNDKTESRSETASSQMSVSSSQYESQTGSEQASSERADTENAASEVDPGAMSGAGMATMTGEVDYIGPILRIVAKDGTAARAIERVLANYPLTFLEEEASDGYFVVQLMDELEDDQLQDVVEMIKDEPYIISVEVLLE